MRKNTQRISELKIELIDGIKKFINTINSEQLEFTTHFNIGVETLEFDDDHQIIMRLANFITNDGFVIDEEANEIPLNELSIIELGFILDELEENKFIKLEK